MKICLAQIRSVSGDISSSIARHVQFIKASIEQGCKAIFFPELSLTSYEPKLANELQTDIDDQRFAIFQELSDKHDIYIGLGMPCKGITKPRISMLIFSPKQQVIQYSKQILHEDEYPYFEHGTEQVIVHIEEQSLAFAICYESRIMDHFQNAKNLGATLYIASVAKSFKGLNVADAHYKVISQTFPVMMVNGVGEMDDFTACGSSGVWSNGVKLVQAGTTSEGLVIYETNKGETSVAFEEIR